MKTVAAAAPQTICRNPRNQMSVKSAEICLPQAGLLPCFAIFSAQVSEPVLRRYRQDGMLVLTGILGLDDLFFFGLSAQPKCFQELRHTDS